MNVNMYRNKHKKYKKRTVKHKSLKEKEKQKNPQNFDHKSKH